MMLIVECQSLNGLLIFKEARRMEREREKERDKRKKGMGSEVKKRVTHLLCSVGKLIGVLV